MLFYNDFILWLIVSMMIDGISGISYNQPKFCPFTTWHPHGKTFANSSTVGYLPYGIFVNTDNTVYVPAISLNLVQFWAEGSMTPTGNISLNLNTPLSVFVTMNGDIYVDNGVNGRVDKWTSNATNRITAMYVNINCFDLFVDINNTLYCSMQTSNLIVANPFNSNPNVSITVGGNGTAGSTPNMLDYPLGIFVDVNFNLNVADCHNNRNQLFRSGELNGTTVAGNGAAETITLLYPTGIVLDSDGYLYIVDHGTNRIIGSGPNGFRCLVGCFGNGSESNQLSRPMKMYFDSFGNMFVTDYGNHRIQTFILATNSCDLSYNQPKFSLCASWNEPGITFANKNTVGNAPYGIFVDASNTVYVNNRQALLVQVWSYGSVNPTRTISGNPSYPRGLFVTINGDIYVATGASGRVNKWSLNTTSSEIVTNFTGVCFSLFVDINNNLYCSVGARHQIVKTSLNSSVKTLTAVAGIGINGSASYTLSAPRGVFVDVNLGLYVADSGNNRIQLFRSGEMNGTTVAGNGASATFTLIDPHGITLDAGGYLFIVDSGNSRIITSGPNGFRCLVGCNGNGSTPNKLSFPQTMAFDSYGNIFVNDRDNNRVQKFILATNSCNSTSTTTTLTRELTTVQMAEQTTVDPSVTYFVPTTCSDTTRIGLTCNISNMLCDILKPCQHKGICNNTNITQSGYQCSCPIGFHGNNCQYDHRLCPPNTCGNTGVCIVSNTTAVCICASGWQGNRCQTKINYCENVVCMNYGVCRPLLLNYTCECLSGSYFGRHCEITTKKIVIYQIISKSFAYTAIIAIVSVALFIIVMDILKYCFGIDPICRKLEQRVRKQRSKKKNPPVILRFVYVNSTAQPPSDKRSSTTENQ